MLRQLIVPPFRPSSLQNNLPFIMESSPPSPIAALNEAFGELSLDTSEHATNTVAPSTFEPPAIRVESSWVPYAPPAPPAPPSSIFAVLTSVTSRVSAFFTTLPANVIIAKSAYMYAILADIRKQFTALSADINAKETTLTSLNTTNLKSAAFHRKLQKMVIAPQMTRNALAGISNVAVKTAFNPQTPCIVAPAAVALAAAAIAIVYPVHMVASGSAAVVRKVYGANPASSGNAAISLRSQQIETLAAEIASLKERAEDARVIMPELAEICLRAKTVGTVEAIDHAISTLKSISI